MVLVMWLTQLMQLIILNTAYVDIIKQGKQLKVRHKRKALYRQLPLFQPRCSNLDGWQKQQLSHNGTENREINGTVSTKRERQTSESHGTTDQWTTDNTGFYEQDIMDSLDTMGYLDTVDTLGSGYNMQSQWRKKINLLEA